MKKIADLSLWGAAIATLLLSAACASETEYYVDNIPLSDRAISFDVKAEQVESRGALYVDHDLPVKDGATPDPNTLYTVPRKDLETMVVNGFYYSAQSSLGQAYMYEQYVHKNGGNWEYTPVKYWPNVGTVDFYAYAPANRHDDGTIVTAQSATVKENPTGSGIYELTDYIDASSYFSQLSYYHDQYNALLMRCDLPASRVMNIDTQFKAGAEVVPEAITAGTNNPTTGDPYTPADVTERNTQINNAKISNRNKAREAFGAANDLLYQTDVMFAFDRGVGKKAVTEKQSFKFSHVMAALDVPLPTECLKKIYNDTNESGAKTKLHSTTNTDEDVLYVLIGIEGLYPGGTLAIGGEEANPSITWTHINATTGKYYKVYRLEKTSVDEGAWTAKAMVGTETYTMTGTSTALTPGTRPTATTKPLFFHVPAQTLTNQFKVTFRMYDAYGTQLQLSSEGGKEVHEWSSQPGGLTLTAGTITVLNFGS